MVITPDSGGKSFEVHTGDFDQRSDPSLKKDQEKRSEKKSFFFFARKASDIAQEKVTLVDL